MAKTPEQQQADAKLRRQEELNDIRALMTSPAGRRFAWRMLDRCGVYQTSFTGNSGTFFKEGERNVGLWLLADIHEVALDEFLVMMKEAKRNE